MYGIQYLHTLTVTQFLDGGKGTFRNVDMAKRSTLADISRCILGIVMNTPIKTLSHGDTQLGAVVHTDVVMMNGLSLRCGWYFVTFIDEARVYGKTFHTKTKGEVAELLKHQPSSD